MEGIYEYDGVQLREGDVIFDCGANIGLFSIVALNRIGPSGRLVALEPEPSVRAVLESNLSRNCQIKAHSVLNCALYSDRRSMKLAVNHKAFTMHRLETAGTPSNADDEIIRVQTTTIDDLVADLRLPKVDFIKMDIEGAEIAALKGAKTTLQTWKPRLAISAYHAFDDLYEIPQLIYRINPAYQVYVRRDLSPICYAW